MKKAKSKVDPETGLTKANRRTKEREAYRKQAIVAARNEHGCDEIEIDSDAQLSENDEGTWVQAWVFVSHEDIKNHRKSKEKADS